MGWKAALHRVSRLVSFRGHLSVQMPERTTKKESIIRSTKTVVILPVKRWRCLAIEDIPSTINGDASKMVVLIAESCLPFLDKFKVRSLRRSRGETTRALI